MHAELAIIGGSGIYELDEFEPEARERVQTPFGATSGDVVVGHLDGVALAFVARHGDGHRVSPTDVPYRANIYALKSLGVHTVIGVNAVGSLHLAYAPGHLVVPDDLCDRTYARAASFFSEGLVAHVGFAEPFCGGVRAALHEARSAVSTTVHGGGTLLVVEGPRFSTRAESALYRSWGMRVIGMTTMPEAVLAREAGMCYATIGVITDYDVWHRSEGSVSADVVMRTMHHTIGEARGLLRSSLAGIASRSDCACRHALEGSIATRPDAVDAALTERLLPVTGDLPDPGLEGAS